MLNPQQFGPNPGLARKRNVNVYRTVEGDKGLFLRPNPNVDKEPQIQLEDQTVRFGDQEVTFSAGVTQRNGPRPKISLGRDNVPHMN